MKKLFLCFLCVTGLHASKLDLGLGGGVMFYPDYLGSKNSNSLGIPYPYISYQSDNLSIDREGLKQNFFQYGDFSIQLSGAGSLPVTSSGSREGMDDLDPAVEFGPAFMYTAYDNNGLTLKLDLPLRAVLSSDFKSIDYRGYIYELRAEVDYEVDDYLLQFQTGAMYSDSKYHNYLYGVKTNDVTDSRAFYEAQAGYTAYKTSIGFTKRLNQLWMGAFVRHYSLTHSTISNSPLKEQNSALYGGVFLAYIFNDDVTRSIQNWLP